MVGGSSAGLTVGHQLLRSGKFAKDDITIIDPTEWHGYQPGWTLVGGGLETKDELRKPLASLVDLKIRHYTNEFKTFIPKQNTVGISNGKIVNCDQLVICPGIRVDFKSIKGLAEAVHDPHSPVFSIYSYDTCAKLAHDITNFKKGRALFTCPIRIIKCAGAPKKIMLLAMDGWRRAGQYNPDPSKSDIQTSFATAIFVMFGVLKYSQRLDETRN